MEAAEPGSSGAGKRGGRRGAALHFGVRAIVSGTGASVAHRADGPARLRVGWLACGSAFGAADHVGLCGGGRVPASEDSLDVVAGDWRPGNWTWRTDFSRGAGRWLRHDWRFAARQRDDKGDPRDFAGEVVHLGGVVRIGNVGRRAGAAADDGRGAGRIGGDVPAERRRGLLAAYQHGSDSWRDDAVTVYEHC